MGSNSSDANPNDRVWPYSAAASTGPSAGSAHTLLCAILAAGGLDEIATADGAVERNLRRVGHVDGSGRLRSGVVFWVYPTGGRGPYEELGDGTVLQHGLLLTVERGAALEEAVKRAEAAVPETGIVHEHVGAAD